MSVYESIIKISNDEDNLRLVPSSIKNDLIQNITIDKLAYLSGNFNDNRYNICLWFYFL